jgi:hypothetical protein
MGRSYDGSYAEYTVVKVRQNHDPGCKLGGDFSRALILTYVVLGNPSESRKYNSTLECAWCAP